MSMGDFAIKPIAPPIELDEDVQEEVLDQADQKKANAYFHPVWSVVEEIVLKNIEKYTVKPSAHLIAEEYKIKSLADEQTRSELIGLLQEIQDAVTAAEGIRTGDN